MQEASASRNMPTNTARRVQSSSQSISNSAKARLWVAPELSDPVDPVKSGASGLEEFGGGSGAQRVEALPESALDVLEVHEGER